MVDRRRRRLRSTALAGGVLFPDNGLIARNKNTFDPTTLKFLDTVGANERTLYPLQHIAISSGDVAGGAYFVNSAMVTAGTTITGTTKNASCTSVLTSPSAGRLNAAAGTLWDFTVTWSDGKISSYAYCSLITTTYAVCFDRSGNGRHLVATGFSDLSAVCLSGRSFGSDVLNLYGWSAGGVSNVELLTTAQQQFNSGWTQVGESTQTGTGNIISTAGVYSALSAAVLISGRVYRLGYDVLSNGAGTLANQVSAPLDSSVGNGKVFGFTAAGVTLEFKRGSGVTNIVIDNASLKESYPSTVPIPAQTLNPSLDALGNALTYPGRAKYSIVPKGRTGNCATLASGTSIAITGVTGAKVLSKEGTGTVTIGTNVINRATDGTLYNLKLTLVGGKVLTLPLTEGSGTTVYAYDSDGTNYTGTITASDINAFWAGKQTTYFPSLQYGYRASGSVFIPANPFTPGLACDGNALTYQPLKFNASSNYSLADAKQVRDATGFTYGVANDFFNADGTVKELTFSALDAAGTGPRFYLGTKGTALYSIDQTTKDSLIEKLLKV